MTPTPSILIVDDNPANLSVLTTMLTQYQYKVRPAISGELALSVAQKTLPDLILLDIQMPGMNGFEVCEHLKADPRTRPIPVIFISALDAIDDKLKAFSTGGVDYITKPFQLEEVHARVQAHLMLVLQQRRIEALVNVKDDLMRIVSHDLKNPIANVIGYAELMDEILGDGEPVETDKLQVMAKRIQRAAENMLGLVEDLLDLGRAEQRIPIEKRPMQLLAILEEVVSSYAFNAEQKNIRLHYNASQPMPEIMADPRRLRQIFNNLISNAIKYTPDGGQVTVTVSQQNGSAFVVVEDTGYGIPPQDLPHIFDKFYRVQSTQHLQAEGTGLGLSIVRALVEQHNGEISVDSVVGEGSAFTVRLPL
jgi:two-component system sensor histidine kinase/response regulator